MKIFILLSLILTSCINSERKIASFDHLPEREAKVVKLFDDIFDEFANHPYEIEANVSEEYLSITVYYDEKDEEQINLASGIRKRNLRILTNELYFAQQGKSIDTDGFKKVMIKFLKAN